MTLRKLGIVVLVAALAPRELRARDICSQYNCEVDYQCEWRVVPDEFTPPQSLHDERSGGVAHARIRGACAVAEDPFLVEGHAVSGGRRVGVTDSTDRPARASWVVEHVKTCPACTGTEGRAFADAALAFKVRAEIEDPGNADALALGKATLHADEIATGCLADVSGDVHVGSSGSQTAQLTLSRMGGAGVGVSKQFGNARRLQETFSDFDRTPDVEVNRYVVTMIASIDRAALQADGNFLFTAVAQLDMDSTEFVLHLHLSCDFCVCPKSRVVENFPQ